MQKSCVIKIEIKPMLESHLCDVVTVHSKAFNGFFLTLMGEKFLRHYYKSVIDYKDSIALIAVDEKNQVTGLAVGFKNPNKFYNHFNKYWIRMLPAAAIGFLRHPSLVFMILRNACRVRESNLKTTEESVELASICTNITNQNIGSTLLKYFISSAEQTGANEVTLTTDENENTAARSFYERHGFKEAGRKRRGRRWLVCYSLCLNNCITH